MPHALVEKYIHERDQLVNTVSVLKNKALDQDNDPNDTDLEAMSRAYERINKLDELIKIVGEDHAMDDDVRDKLLKPTPETLSGGVKYRSAGEMVWDCIHANYGQSRDPGDDAARHRWDGVMKRAAQHMGTEAAATTPVAGGMGGLYVVPVVGPVISMFPVGQPWLSAVGRRPAPDALVFTRPRIVDPDFETGVGPQGLQKAELPSKKFDIKVDQVGLETVGGYLNVSQQLLSLQPTSWDIIVGQLQARLAWAGEAALTTEAEKTTAHITLAAGATPQEVIAALYEAAALVYQNTRALPTWIAMGPAGWAMLGSLCDAAGRPLFPFLGASNALGAANLGDLGFAVGPLGLQSVVTPGITDTTLFLGNSLGIEAYVYSFPILEAVEPALLGRQIAVAEAMAFYRPTTSETTTMVGAAPQAEGEIVAAPAPAAAGQGNGIVTVGP